MNFFKTYKTFTIYRYADRKNFSIKEDKKCTIFDSVEKCEKAIDEFCKKKGLIF